MAIYLMLAGCSTESASTRMISGVAFVGHALTGLVTIKDASSPTREKAAFISKSGTFSLDVSDMKGPYILTAHGSIGRTDYLLYSFAEKPGIVNINPLTHLAVTAAAGADDPEQIYAHPEPVTLQKIKLNLPVVVNTIQTKLKPLFKLYDVDNADPIKDPFTFYGSGFDALFDDMKFAFTNGDLAIVDAATGSDIFRSKAAYINVGRFVKLPLRRPLPQS